MFSNVTYRPTVYKTGPSVLYFVCQSPVSWKQKCCNPNMSNDASTIKDFPVSFTWLTGSTFVVLTGWALLGLDYKFLKNIGTVCCSKSLVIHKVILSVALM